MSSPDEKKPPQSRMVRICSLVFVVIGVVAYEVVAPRLFPKPHGGGINTDQVLGAAIVGGFSAALGGSIGKLIDSLRK